MRHPIRAALVGGLALLSVGGLAGVAQAQSAANHVVTLALPAGGEVQVAYAGSTPPRLVGFAPAPLSADPFLLTRSAFGAASPFAAFDAEMPRCSGRPRRCCGRLSCWRGRPAGRRQAMG